MDFDPIQTDLTSKLFAFGAARADTSLSLAAPASAFAFVSGPCICTCATNPNPIACATRCAMHSCPFQGAKAN